MTLLLHKELQPFSNDPLRPRYHFLPPGNWINDPNGLIYWQGVYHLFYQYNPQGAFWGTIHWGHASSADLVNWEHHPIALHPGPGAYDRDGCWSGCAVNDAGTPTLLYTGIGQGQEHVCLARGDADLQNWQKDPANPIIASPPAELHIAGFRDPFVWYEDNSWWMVIGSGMHEQTGAVLLYKSADLIHWEYLHPLLVGDGTSGTMWECPNFFHMGDRAALIVSVLPLEQVLIFVGGYQQRKFLPDYHTLLDGGPAYYAPQVMRNAEDQWLVLGWLKERSGQEAGWAGAISLPRILSLHEHGRLQVRPVSELKQLRYQEQTYTKELYPGDSTPIRINRLGQWECEGTIQPATEGNLTLTLEDEEQVYVTIYLNLTEQKCGMQHGQQAVETWLSYYMSSDNLLHFHCFFDHSILEVFIQQERCFTWRVYPASVATTYLRLDRQGSTMLSAQLQMWSLHDAEFGATYLEKENNHDHAR